MKALHLQKAKKTSAEDSSFGTKQSSDSWFSSSDHEDDNGGRWFDLKRSLIRYHDETKEAFSLRSLVKFWDDGGELSTLTGVSIPLEHVSRLYAMAKVAVELNDFLAAKCHVLAAGLLLQSRVTSTGDIKKLFVDGKDEQSSAAALAFCDEVNEATKSPDAMRAHLERWDPEEVKSKLASAEPLINISFKSGESEEAFVRGVNSLTTLGSLLRENQISSARIKHNGERLFLSSCGKKSLAELGFVDGDVLELDGGGVDPSAPSACCADITNKPGKKRGGKKKKGKAKK